MTIKTTTVELTSKTLKLQLFVSSLMAVLAIPGFIFLNDDPVNAAIAFGAFVVGTLWYVTTKVRIWWNHS